MTQKRSRKCSIKCKTQDTGLLFRSSFGVLNKADERWSETLIAPLTTWAQHQVLGGESQVSGLHTVFLVIPIIKKMWSPFNLVQWFGFTDRCLIIPMLPFQESLTLHESTNVCKCISSLSTRHILSGSIMIIQWKHKNGHLRWKLALRLYTVLWLILVLDTPSIQFGNNAQVTKLLVLDSLCISADNKQCQSIQCKWNRLAKELILTRVIHSGQSKLDHYGSFVPDWESLREK